jgi:hypothetical protein
MPPAQKTTRFIGKASAAWQHAPGCSRGRAQVVAKVPVVAGAATEYYAGGHAAGWGFVDLRRGQMKWMCESMLPAVTISLAADDSGASDDLTSVARPLPAPTMAIRWLQAGCQPLTMLQWSMMRALVDGVHRALGVGVVTGLMSRIVLLPPTSSIFVIAVQTQRVVGLFDPTAESRGRQSQPVTDSSRTL